MSKITCTIHITIQTSILFAHASTRLFLHPRHPKRMLSQSSRQRRVLPSCTLVQLIPKPRRSAARTACTRAAAARGSDRRARRSRRARRRGAARRSTACCRRRWRRSACVVKRSEIVNLGGLWLEVHGLPEGSEVLDLSSRVRRAASRLWMQTVEPVVASYGLTKTATLTML